MRKTLLKALVVTALAALASGQEARSADGSQLSDKGQEVSTREGYDARPPALPVHPYELPLALALDQKDPPRDLGFRSGVLFLTNGADLPESVVLLEVPLGVLGTRVEAETGVWNASVSMLAYVRDAEGRLVSRLSRDWPLRGTGSPSGLRGRNALLKRTVRLAPGRYTLEAAVRDRETGRIGARHVPFVVPETSSALSLGSVAVVRFQRAPPNARDSSDPLLVRGLSALPVLGAPIAIESGQVGVLTTLHPERGAGPVSVTVEFRRDGEVLAQASPEIPKPDLHGRITLAHSFALPSTEPGRYEVWVRVRQGKEKASAATSFQIARVTPMGILSPDVARAGIWR